MDIDQELRRLREQVSKPTQMPENHIFGQTRISVEDDLTNLKLFVNKAFEECEDDMNEAKKLYQKGIEIDQLLQQLSVNKATSSSK